VEICPLEAAREQFEVMFWGPVHICKEVSDGRVVNMLNMLHIVSQAIRIFREVNPPGDGGLIFNVSSAGGYFAQPSIPYYAAAKFGMPLRT
jgi:NAD(P)-dependent dehydrogenase (short-subunit alcohol dehydrogenase family)